MVVKIPAAVAVGLLTLAGTGCSASNEDLRHFLDANRVRVSAIEYQGPWVQVILETAEAGNFTTNLREAAFFDAPVEVGDEVEIRWAPEDVHVMQPEG